VEDSLSDLMRNALDHYKKGEIDIAEDLFSKAIKINPDSYQAIYNIGIIKLIKNNAFEAEDYIKKAFLLNKSEKYFSSVIDVYLTQNKTKDAENFLNKWNNLYSNELISMNHNKIIHQNELHLMVKEYNLSKNNYTDKFEEKVKKFVKKYPKNSLSWKILGNILYQKRNDRDKNYIDTLINTFETSYSQNKKDIDVILKLGSLYNEYNLFDKAISLYSISKKLLPNEHLLYFNCGNTFAKMGNVELAKNEFKISIEMNPNHFNSYKNIAKAYKDLNEIDKSEEMYKKMITIDKNDASGYRGLGAIKILKSQLKDAKELLLKSITIDPNNTDAKQNLSICYFRLGETKKGIDCAKDNVGVLSFSIDKKYGKFKII